MDIDMQHGHKQGQAACTRLPMVHAHIHAAFPCPSCMSMFMSVLLVQAHVAGTWTSSRDMDMQLGHGRAANT
jgi:hypothetical protein